MARLNGSDLMVFEKDKEAYKSIAHSKTHTLNLSRSEIDVADKDSGDMTDTEAGPLTWGISTNLTATAETHKKLVDAILANTVFELAWNMKAEEQSSAPLEGWTPALAGGYEGKAIITSVTVTANNGEKVSLDVEFKGKGEFKAKA